LKKDESLANKTASDESTMSFLLGLRARGVLNTATLRAFERVSRIEFVGHHFADLVHEDIALPIACGQSQTSPGNLARMLAALGASSSDRILEVGTGSGYSAALLSHIGLSVISLERYRSLAEAAKTRFERLGLANISVRHADGSRGLIAEGPFNRIIVHCAVEGAIEPFLEQLTPGGALVGVLRVGRVTELTRWRRSEGNRSVEMDHFGQLDLPTLVNGLSEAL
jgi:protein-L-isoaspartate(D-aspartate) O-methyltransferase